MVTGNQFFVFVFVVVFEIFVVNVKGDHMHSISFKCCCYWLGIAMLLIDMLFESIVLKITTKPTAGSSSFCINW